MRGGFKVRWVPLVAVLVILATGCSGNGAHPEAYSTTIDSNSTPVIESQFSNGPLDWHQAGLLGNTGSPAISGRTTSGSKVIIYGDEYVDEYGTNNRPGESSPNGHIIAPGGDDDLLAWADISATRPSGAWAHKWWEQTAAIKSAPMPPSAKQSPDGTGSPTGPLGKNYVS